MCSFNREQKKYGHTQRVKHFEIEALPGNFFKFTLLRALQRTIHQQEITMCCLFSNVHPAQNALSFHLKFSNIFFAVLIVELLRNVQQINNHLEEISSL